MEATANMLEGDTSASFFSMERMTSSAVIFKPALTSTNRSVLAVHNTTMVSNLFFALKLRISRRMCSKSYKNNNRTRKQGDKRKKESEHRTERRTAQCEERDGREMRVSSAILVICESS